MAASAPTGVGWIGGRTVKGAASAGVDPSRISSREMIARQLLPWQGPVPRPV
jgi:hypothetical protein